MTQARPSFMRRILREPLLHFVLLGAVVFTGYMATHPIVSSDERTIVVDREHLLTFLQYRSKAFDRQHFAEVLDTMSPTALQDLIDGYVQEEAMYREAKSLKLDDRDYVARRRLVQQLEFITQGFVADQKPLTGAELARYYDTHKADYYQEPSLTFTHVFFDRAKHGDKAEALARAELAKLNAGKVPFTQAMAHGDRSLYDVNYVRQDLGVIISDFGKPLAEKLLSLTPSLERWQGPFESKFGVELVMVTEIDKGGVPPLAQIRDRVKADAIEADKKARIDQAIASIVKSYKVKIEAIQHKAEASGS
jgi:parvulin-like peptidyl-prolyl isomerase